MTVSPGWMPALAAFPEEDFTRRPFLPCSSCRPRGFSTSTCNLNQEMNDVENFVMEERGDDQCAITRRREHRGDDVLMCNCLQ